MRLPPLLVVAAVALLLHAPEAARTAASAAAEVIGDAITIRVNASTSLRQAQRQARTQAGEGREVTLELLPGVHSVTDGPLVLGPEDAGISWTGQAGAVISGGASLPLAGFEPVPASDPVRARLPTHVAHSVIRTDVSAHRESFTSPASSGGMGLADGSGAPLPAARWPNPAAPDSVGVRDGWATTGVGSNGSGFRFPSSAPLPSNTSGTVAHGFWWLDWSSAKLPVTRLADGFAFVAAGAAPPYVKEMGKGRFPSGSRFFFLNQPEYLDAAGEWWIDQGSGYLYLLPPAHFTPHVFLSLSPHLFELQGASSAVEFTGLTMVSAQRAGITCGANNGPGHVTPCAAQSVVIDNCSLLGLGGTAIEVTDGANWSITHSTVRYTGGVGVLLSGGNYTSLRPSGHLLANCTITDFNLNMAGFQAGVKIEGVGTRVLQNELARGAAQALLWSGNDHLISANVIHDIW